MSLQWISTRLKCLLCIELSVFPMQIHNCKMNAGQWCNGSSGGPWNLNFVINYFCFNLNKNNFQLTHKGRESIILLIQWPIKEFIRHRTPLHGSCFLSASYITWFTCIWREVQLGSDDCGS